MVKARYGLLFFPSEWVRAFRGLEQLCGRGSPACNMVALVALMKRDRQRGEGQKQGDHVGGSGDTFWQRTGVVVIEVGKVVGR